MQNDVEAELREAVAEGLVSEQERDTLREEARRLGRGPLVLLRERGRLSEDTLISLIAQGLSNDEIAAQEFLSVNTVKTYIRTAYRKIGVHTRPQAVVWEVQHGVDVEPER